MSGRNGHVDSAQLREFVQRVETELGAAKMQEFLESCAKALAAQLLRMVKQRTPKITTTLINGWTVGEVRRNGDTYTIEVINPTYYASYVEFGHRQEPGRYVPALGKRLKQGWVEGKFMLTISEQEVQNNAPKILEKKLQRKLGEIFK